MNPYLGHTAEEQRQMLAAIGVESMDELFASIPREVRYQGDLPIPAALSEAALLRLAAERAAQNQPAVGARAFLGAGIYEHFIPSVISHLAGRGEFLTAYTPYQPEASQGMLQAIFEFQTMICELTGMAIANASLYDGSTALAEAALAALGAAKKGRTKILLAPGVHPQWRETLQSYLVNLPYKMAVAPMRDGRIDFAALGVEALADVAAVAVPQVNYFGLIEDMPAIAEAVHGGGADLIAIFDPIALSVLAAPGEYGADIAVGEGQGLGLAPYAGGDTVGLFACSEEYMRRMPGRLIGEALDRNGKIGYVLALQTREQHIRREKATSNICTNQGLNALKAAMFLSALGAQGLREMAEGWTRNTHLLVEKLKEKAGARLAFGGNYFGECVLRFGVDAKKLQARLIADGFMPGVSVSDMLPEMDDALLLCATETKTSEDIEAFAGAARSVISDQ